MALNIEYTEDNKFAILTGVYRGQTRPVFLGVTGLTQLKKTSDEGWGNGTFAIGFDNRVSPAQVRIYYEYKDSIIPGTNPDKYIGLVMTSEIRYDGVLIPPSVMSSAIGYQNLYTYTRLIKKRGGMFTGPSYSISLNSINMMDSSKSSGYPFELPYFSQNALSWSDIQQDTLFQANPLNGSILKLTNGQYPTDDGASLCASLIAPIGMDIDGPSQNNLISIINGFQIDGIEPILQFEIDSEDASNGMLVSKTIAAMNSASETTVNIKYIQMYGEIPLIILDDNENYDPAFLVIPSSSTNTANIYMLDATDLENAFSQPVLSRFDRFMDHIKRTNTQLNPGYDYKILEGMGKGGGDRAFNAIMMTNYQPVISFDYKVYCIGSGTITSSGNVYNAYHCFDGIQFRVLRTFNKDTFQFDPVSIGTPARMKLNDIIYMNQSFPFTYTPEKFQRESELYKYLTSLKNPKEGSVNQSQWFQTYTPPEPNSPVNPGITDTFT